MTEVALTLAQDQQRDLYAKLFEYIGDLHQNQLKNDLAIFTKEYRTYEETEKCRFTSLCRY